MTDINDLWEPGDDREPVEPDEYEQQPVDLEEVEQRLKRLQFLAPPFGMAATRAELNGTEDLHDLAALIGQEVYGLMAELRAARERIAEWEALETREEWTVTPGRDVVPSMAEPACRRFSSGDLAAAVAINDGHQLWRQRSSVHPWEPIALDAPF